MLAARGIVDVTLTSGHAGQFDACIDGALRYSRASTGRFPTDREIEALV